MDRFSSIEEREQYLRNLVQEYRTKMCAYFAHNLDAYKKQAAEDLAQELFAEVIRTVRNQNKPLNHPQAYLYTAAKNLCSRARKEQVSDSLEQCMTSTAKCETEPVQLVQQGTEKMLVWEQFQNTKIDIEHLTGITRDVMRLVAEDLNVCEIAKKLRISEETVRHHRTKGREELLKNSNSRVSGE
jgi:RNA polymerase sigma factor (sigma-70 family)